MRILKQILKSIETRFFICCKTNYETLSSIMIYWDFLTIFRCKILSPLINFKDLLLATLKITYSPKDVIQFFIRVLVMINLILMLYASFRANHKAIEGVSPSEYKCYLIIQIYTLGIFFLDFLFSDIFGCSDFYINLYYFKNKGDETKSIDYDCEKKMIFLRIFVRSIWILLDVWKICFSFKIMRYIKLVFKSLNMNIYDNEILKSEPVVIFN